MATCHLDPASIKIAWNLMVMLFSDFYAENDYRIAGYFCGYKFLRFGHKID